MKKAFAVAALLAALSPLSQAQNYPSPHRDTMNPSEPWRPGPNMRNDRPVIIVHERPVVRPQIKQRPHIRCRDGSRQYTQRACRNHRGVRR